MDWDDVELAADIGCGSGRFLPSLAARAERAIGLDLAPAMVTEVRTRAAEPLVVADVCHLPLREACLDRALAAWMLYHAADPALACRELRRVVRPGGALIAVTNAAAHIAELDEIYAEAAAALLDEGRNLPPLPATRFRLDEAADSLTSAFDTVVIHARRVRLRVPAPEPVVAYLASMRGHIDAALAADGVSFDDLAPHVEAAATARISAAGAVEITGLPAAIVCR